MESSYKREFPSIYRGRVESNVDPKNLGRCKIRVPSIHGELTYPVDILPWARPLVTTPVSKGRGSVNIPGIGDIVWVFFEEANRDYPVYIGGTYGKDELSIDSNTVDFYIENDARFSYDRATNTYTLQVGENLVKVTPTDIQIVGDVRIKGNVYVEGIIKATDDVVGGNSISLVTHTHPGVMSGNSSTEQPK